MFDLICSKTKLPQFVIQVCPNLLYIYIFVNEICCSYYNLCELGRRYLIHQFTWLIYHVTTLYVKKALSSLSLGQSPANFSKMWLKLSWSQPSSHVIYISCDHVIFLKRSISRFTMPITIKPNRVMSKGKGAPLALSSNLSIKWTLTFWETSCIH